MRQLEQQQVQLQNKIAEQDVALKNALAEIERLKAQPIQLPADPVVTNHSYGPKIISLAMEMAKICGLRASVAAIAKVFDWLGIQVQLPDWTSVRMWMIRMGIAMVDEEIEKADDWIWIVDHSNQISKEKVLVILGVRQSKLPENGQTLRLEDVRVLAVVPGTQWKTENVAAEYKKLADRSVMPKFILTDGAPELRDSVDFLEKNGKKPILLRDMKHVAANILEKTIGNDKRFKEFSTKVAATKCAIQQTELAHFTPPAQKPKARFMNLGPYLNWATMALYHFDHPETESRTEITPDRMEEKLGWLDGYRDDIAKWNRCQQVVDTSLHFINTQGLTKSSHFELEQRLNDLGEEKWKGCETSHSVATKLVEFVKESGSPLNDEERTWLSSEIIESAFGAYKAVEGQHSKGGFTTLIGSFAAICQPCTPEKVRAGLTQVSIQKMHEWKEKKLPRTLTSKRNQAYKETKPKKEKTHTNQLPQGAEPMFSR